MIEVERGIDPSLSSVAQAAAGDLHNIALPARRIVEAENLALVATKIASDAADEILDAIARGENQDSGETPTIEERTQVLIEEGKLLRASLMTVIERLRSWDQRVEEQLYGEGNEVPTSMEALHDLWTELPAGDEINNLIYSKDD